MDFSETLTLGFLIAVALLAGGLGESLRLPKVTAYLLAGMLFGQSGLGLIPEDHIHDFHPLLELAMALVLFELGCHFPLARLRRTWTRVARLSIGDVGLTFLAVTGGMLLVGQTVEVSLLLGAVAMVTAPATTMLVLSELEPEGPVTEYTRSLVVVNNLVTIVVFEFLFVGIEIAHGTTDAPFVEVWRLFRDLFASGLIGTVAGIALSFCFGLVAGTKRLILVVGLAILMMGVCDLLHLPLLVTFLAMGIAVANSSYQGRQILGETHSLTGFLCVVFFTTHGVEMSVSDLATAGAFGAVYIVCRMFGKYFGARTMAGLVQEEKPVQKWLGGMLFSHAGAAIALCAIAMERDEALGRELQSIVLGTVIVFELIGPISIRFSVLKAGELPLAHAITHHSFDMLDQFRTVVNRILLSLGYDPWRNRSPDEMTVNELMRRKVDTLKHNATFDEVIKVFEHARFDTIPVVGSEQELIGVIRYEELSHALFVPAMSTLVRAADVTTPVGRVLSPEDSLADAWSVFQTSEDDCVPVVSKEKSGNLVGILRRRDVLKHLIRERSGQ